uniref:Uncharacterized protein n=1 Tax=Moniliophthora roreri TaxID=221103 RepID=A0A0W0G0N9_MONRR
MSGTREKTCCYGYWAFKGHWGRNP